MGFNSTELERIAAEAAKTRLLTQGMISPC
jgi:hypothetical protein